MSRRQHAPTSRHHLENLIGQGYGWRHVRKPVSFISPSVLSPLPSTEPQLAQRCSTQGGEMGEWSSGVERRWEDERRTKLMGSKGVKYSRSHVFKHISHTGRDKMRLRVQVGSLRLQTTSSSDAILTVCSALPVAPLMQRAVCINATQG